MTRKEPEIKRTARLQAPEDNKSTVRFERDLFRHIYGPQASGEIGPGGAGVVAPGAGDDSAYIIGGRYSLQEGLAMGGQGAVYKVLHLGLRKHFALKIIHPGRSADYETLRSFDQEIQVLSRVNHPNIVQVTDFGLDDRFGVYLVMEYLRGQTLLDRITREIRLDQVKALRIALQVAEALRHLHELDIIHRDIKPENVFVCTVSWDGEPKTVAKLIDFGLARPHIDDAEVDESERAGTPEFAAPEQFQGAAPLPSMDIYALGVLLFEMVTGQMAFEGTPEEVVKRKMGAPPPSPNDRLAEPLDGELTRLITRTMAREPAVRPATMGELIGDLRRVLASLEAASGEASAAGEGGALQGAPTARLGADPAGAPFDLASCPVPVCVVGSDGRVVSANEGFSDLVCLPVTMLAGTLVSDTLLAAVYPDMGSDLDRVMESGEALQRSLRLDAGGRRSRAHVWLVPFDSAPGRQSRVWFSVLMTA